MKKIKDGWHKFYCYEVLVIGGKVIRMEGGFEPYREFSNRDGKWNVSGEYSIDECRKLFKKGVLEFI